MNNPALKMTDREDDDDSDEQLSRLAEGFGAEPFERAKHVLQESMNIIEHAGVSNPAFGSTGWSQGYSASAAPLIRRGQVLRGMQDHVGPRDLAYLLLLDQVAEGQSQQPAREVVQNRVMKAVSDLLDRLSERDLTWLSEVPEADLLPVITREYMEAELRPDEREAWRRTQLAQQRVFQEGIFLTAGSTAERLQISRQALDQRRRKRQLLAVRRARNWLYPELQFARNAVVNGLEEVLSALPYEDGWALLQWLSKERDTFEGRSGFAALRDGDVQLVVAEAEKVGEQGAQ